MQTFSENKFKALTLEQQHKHCMHEIKRLYLKESTDFSHYRQLLVWMSEPQEIEWTMKQLADRFHYHALFLTQEGHVLPRLQKHDKIMPAEAPLEVSIVLDNLRSAHNVGSIVRTTEAYSLGEIFSLGTTPTTQHTQVQKTSMGASQWLEVQSIKEIDHLPRPIIALETVENSKPLHQFTFPDSFTLVVGNEEYGCSDEVLAIADDYIHLPLYGRKNSLNVANAFAIAAAEIRRQKHE